MSADRPTDPSFLTSAERWLLLIHQIPPKPDYLRVKIGRRLQRIGAVPVKNSVYVLPRTDQAREDFQWIRTEIVDGGGEAFICGADFVDGLNDDEIRQLFREARAGEFHQIAASARALLGTLDSGLPERAMRTRIEDDLGRLKRRHAAVTAIDFFEAPERGAAREALEAVASRLPAVEPDTSASRGPYPLAEYHRRTWVTREGIFVDRIASAWLIARCIDPDARFKFVTPQGYRPKKNEVRFDMFEAEFTHVGDRCTFETLLARFALDDPALWLIAEVVHDIDLKDAKFEREDAVGIERVLAGIARACPDDALRLERGRQLFDELYALHKAELLSTPSATPSVAGSVTAGNP
jgi:hypothetical protein